MKRTKSINLDRMRKTQNKTSSKFRLKPLAIGIAAMTLAACGDDREAKIYGTVTQCIDENPGKTSECEAAYQQAVKESQDSAPKYRTLRDCQLEFGRDNCVTYNNNGSNWFMPALGGFLFAQALNRPGYYETSPFYTSYSRRSPFFDEWVTADGSTYGRRRYGSIKVDNDVFKPKPAVTRTISRGGFGSKVAAKSSWGGSSSRGGWGG